MSEATLKYALVELGIIAANCIILGNTATGNYLLFDVGGDPTDALKKVEEMGFKKCVGVYFTHGHFDHVSGAKEIKEKTGAPLYLHKKDLDLYKDIENQCRSFGVPIVKGLPDIDVLLEDGDKVKLDNFEGVVLHTPGHSPGSVSFYFKEIGILIDGDTVFRGGMGRTDLWGGSLSVLRDSIENVILKLPPETVIIPGHGSKTTVKRESISFLFYLFPRL